MKPAFLEGLKRGREQGPGIQTFYVSITFGRKNPDGS